MGPEEIEVAICRTQLPSKVRVEVDMLVGVEEVRRHPVKDLGGWSGRARNGRHVRQGNEPVNR